MISNLLDKASYAGNGSNQNFAIPFTVLVSDQNEVGVILRDITQPLVPIDVVQNFGALQQYTLTGANPPGTPFNTTVVMNIAPTSNQIVVVYRILPFTQILNMVTSGTFDFSNINLALDRIVAMIQILNEAISRAPLLQQATQQAQSFLPEPQASKALGYGTDGKTLTLFSTTTVSNAIQSLTGDVTSAGGSAAPTVIAAGAVSLAKMANLAANSIIGNNTGSPATPLALTIAQVTAMLNIATTALKGLVPAWPNDVTKFFSGAGTYLLLPSAYNYNGYYPGSASNYWSTTGASYGAFTVTGSIPTITQITKNNFGAISNATSSDAGINFVAPKTGTIRIIFNISLTGGGTNILFGLRLFETTGSTLIGYSPASYENGTTAASTTIIGYLSVVSGLTYNVVVQGKTSSGTIYINAEGGDMQLGVVMEYVN